MRLGFLARYFDSPSATKGKLVESAVAAGYSERQVTRKRKKFEGWINEEAKRRARERVYVPPPIPLAAGKEKWLGWDHLKHQVKELVGGEDTSARHGDSRSAGNLSPAPPTGTSVPDVLAEYRSAIDQACTKPGSGGRIYPQSEQRAREVAARSRASLDYTQTYVSLEGDTRRIGEPVDHARINGVPPDFEEMVKQDLVRPEDSQVQQAQQAQPSQFFTDEHTERPPAPAPPAPARYADENEHPDLLGEIAKGRGPQGRLTPDEGITLKFVK